MKLSREEVLHIARLARLGISDEEVERAREQLSNILENFEVLQSVDTDDVPPTAQSLTLQNVLREDKPCASFTREDILANAPQEDEDSFRVRAVLE
ncbi:MAG TPA: Asp-tRNA(Asn)/Glu-tRNA(Gln) amidotransferase subunit GatC [Dehalococcoidia bacterium]|nr:Asp-tRNA(Asn)/Glu-tRNA(Gln) amidotransferase subunit GatC [Dehalococcoidia bacterium]